MNFLRKMRFLLQTYSLFLHDARMYVRYSNGFFSNDNKKKILDYLIVFYHPIEKGLAMPDFRLGFGKERVEKVINICNEYIRKYNDTPNVLIDAIEVIGEYDKVHKSHNYRLDEELQKHIDDLLIRFQDVASSSQLSFNREDFFSKLDAPFPEFASSRRSLRDYDTKQTVDEKILKSAVDLAITAPSTCNRQSVKVHLVKDKELVKQVLSMQSGNRGFGHRADKVLIITSDLQSWNVPGERFSPYIDGGIFAMNLLYALHYYHIGACPLNWSENVESNKKLHQLLGIPNHEIVIMMICCGMAPKEFKIVRSKRKSLNDILEEH